MQNTGHRHSSFCSLEALARSSFCSVSRWGFSSLTQGLPSMDWFFFYFPRNVLKKGELGVRMNLESNETNARSPVSASTFGPRGTKPNIFQPLNSHWCFLTRRALSRSSLCHWKEHSKGQLVFEEFRWLSADTALLGWYCTGTQLVNCSS